MSDIESVRFEIKTPEVIKALQRIAEQVGLTVQETARLLLIGCVARKAAWGDALNHPEPGYEFNRNADGKLMKDDDVYESVYQQVRGFLSILMVSDKLASKLLEVIRISEPKTATLNKQPKKVEPIN